MHFDTDSSIFFIVAGSLKMQVKLQCQKFNLDLMTFDNKFFVGCLLLIYICVFNTQGRNLGCSVTSARTSGLPSIQGIILGESGEG